MLEPDAAEQDASSAPDAPSSARILQVTHATRYVYSTRVDVALHQMHLRPCTSAHQQVLDYALQIDPEPTRTTTSQDVFGNARCHFGLYGAHDGLHVQADSRVALAPRGAGVDRSSSAPWEDVVQRLRYSARASLIEAAEFVFASPFVPRLPELAAYAHASFAPRRPCVAAAIELMQRIHADFIYDPAATDVSTPLAEAFTERRGVCQDFAHILIGCLRALGLPAAYVSGYLLTQPPPGQPRLLGADASHAWARIWCPVLGWIDLDPTNAVVVDGDHVTLAIGRDYGDVMPLRGVILGGGAHQLTVSVSVVPEGDAVANAATSTRMGLLPAPHRTEVSGA